MFVERSMDPNWLSNAYLLADETKFTRRTPFRVPNTERCAGVIVDRMPDRALAGIWTDFGWEIILAK